MDVDGMTGLEQLQAMMAAGKRPAIAETLNFDLASIGEDGAVFEGDPGDRATNPLGTVHGGYAATLLDSACGCAVHARLAVGQGYTTLELKVAYHRGMTSTTGTVRAEGRVLSMGRRVAFAEATLTDADGRLLASATSTLLLFAIEGAALTSVG